MPDFSIRVTRRGSRYFAQATDQLKNELFPTTPTRFALHAVEAVLGFKDQQAGKYNTLVLYQNDHEQEARRQVFTAPHPIPHQRTAIQLAPAVTAPYVGRYELASGHVLAVEQQGNQIIVSVGNQERVQFLPQTETDFFSWLVDAQITFVKNASGGIASLVLHQGGDQTARRLP